MTSRHAMRLLTAVATGAFAFVAMLGATTVQQAGAPPVKTGPYQPLVSPEGKDNFLAYCAVCHGVDAKGRGPAVPALKVPVPDLTTIAKRNGKFDGGAITQKIVGPERLPAAHGSIEMPMWGPLFRRAEGDAVAQLRVANLTTYLQSLQAR